VRNKNEKCHECGAVNRTHGRPCIDAAPTLIHDYADLLDDAPDMYIRALNVGVAEERARIVVLLRAWAEDVEEGNKAAPCGGDKERMHTLRMAANAIENGEGSPAFAR
jgi:hypothetical protein